MADSPSGTGKTKRRSARFFRAVLDSSAAARHAGAADVHGGGQHFVCLGAAGICGSQKKTVGVVSACGGSCRLRRFVRLGIFPLPVVTQDSYEMEVRTRVPGKAEKVMVLTQTQQDAVKALLKEATIARGWETELPYGGYGQTFRVFITTPEGEQCLYLAPEGGCLYSDFDKALIYSVNDYEKLYKAVAQATE